MTEEYDICISCGKVTSYKKKDNVMFRLGYIEGAGQLCLECNQNKIKEKEWKQQQL